MTVVVRKSTNAIAAMSEAKKLVPESTIIGVRANRLLVKVSEKNFNGISGTFLSGNGGTIEKLLFLFGKSSTNVLPYKRGALEICVS